MANTIALCINQGMTWFPCSTPYMGFSEYADMVDHEVNHADCPQLDGGRDNTIPNVLQPMEITSLAMNYIQLILFTI